MIHGYFWCVEFTHSPVTGWKSIKQMCPAASSAKHTKTHSEPIDSPVDSLKCALNGKQDFFRNCQSLHVLFWAGLFLSIATCVFDIYG